MTSDKGNPLDLNTTFSLVKVGDMDCVAIQFASALCLAGVAVPADQAEEWAEALAKSVGVAVKEYRRAQSGLVLPPK